MELDLPDRLKKERRSKPIAELADQLGVGVDILKTEIDRLAEEGYGISREGKMFIRSKLTEARGVFDHSKLYDKRHIEFGLVGDSHLGSKKERLDELESIYDTFEREGVTTVYHLGDMTDGWNVYRGQEFEVHTFGQSEQVDYAVDKYPRRDCITTFFICGNHDLRMYEMGGIDPGPTIAQRRDDLSYLGQVVAKVRFPQGIEAELLHPGGGTAYALSYKAQRYINNLSSQDVPDIMMWGHYHTSFYMHYRNVHFLQTGCFKDAGIWEKRLGLNPDIAGWLVTAEIDSGHIEQFKPELIQPRI